MEALSRSSVSNAVDAVQRLGGDVLTVAASSRSLAFSAVGAIQRMGIRAYACSFVARHAFSAVVVARRKGIDVRTMQLCREAWSSILPSV